MKFGIPNIGFDRLIARLKEAIEYTDDWEESWEEEYGEDWSSEDYAAPEPEMQEELGISREDFVRGEVVLAAMGADLEYADEEQIAGILQRKPELLQLTPQFNVQGQWVHTLRETYIPNMTEVISGIISSNTELCVTAGDQAEFWNFSDYRTVAVILEGVCKILWNADMYSHFDQYSEQLERSIGAPLEYVNEMTEGWLVPGECKLVGLKVNWEKLAERYEGDAERLGRAGEQIKEIAAHFGVPIVQSPDLAKSFVGIDLIGVEEAQNYMTCDIDVESPEHLYEPYFEVDREENYPNTSYEDRYRQEMMKAILAEDADKINEYLSMGIGLDQRLLKNHSAMDSLAELPLETALQLIEPYFYTGQHLLKTLFRSAIWRTNFDLAKQMLNRGFLPTLNDKDILLFLTAFDPPEKEIVSQMLGPMAGDAFVKELVMSLSDESSIETVDYLVNEFNMPDLVWTDLGSMFVTQKPLLEKIYAVAPEKVLPAYEEGANKLDLTSPRVKDAFNKLTNFIEGKE